MHHAVRVDSFDPPWIRWIRWMWGIWKIWCRPSARKDGIGNGIDGNGIGAGGEPPSGAEMMGSIKVNQGLVTNIHRRNESLTPQLSVKLTWPLSVGTFYKETSKERRATNSLLIRVHTAPASTPVITSNTGHWKHRRMTQQNSNLVFSSL